MAFCGYILVVGGSVVYIYPLEARGPPPPPTPQPTPPPSPPIPPPIPPLPSPILVKLEKQL